MKIDEKLEALKAIVLKLENDNLSFDEGLELYEKGAELVKDCFSALNEVKGKVTKIKQEIENYKEEEFK
jgi:exodeoxyribonuclease VII small subunit